jgi:rsbT co-antagonist protein RsbR
MNPPAEQIAALEQRIAYLEAELAAAQRCAVRDHEVLDEQYYLLKALFENAVDVLFIANFDGTLRYVNAAFKRMLGYGDDAINRPTWTYIVEGEQTDRLKDAVAQVMSQGYWIGRLTYRREDGSTFPGLLSTFLIRDRAGEPLARGGFIRDLTEQDRQEQALHAAQQAALRELSTPLMPIADQVVALPLIGSIDAARAQQIVERLIEGVAASRAKTAILDITGVPVVDTQVAYALLQATQAVSLLGAQVILTGIRPEVAQTLVGLGVDMSGIITQATLQQGIAHALRRR